MCWLVHERGNSVHVPLTLQVGKRGECGEDVPVAGVTAVGASVLGRPVWPQAYHDFVRAVDREVWVWERLGEATSRLLACRRGAQPRHLSETCWRASRTRGRRTQSLRVSRIVR